MAEQDPPEKPPETPLEKARRKHISTLQVVNKRGNVSRITREDYDKMSEAYLRGSRAIGDVARQAGIAYRTAKKAIEEGWPDRNWPPLKERAVLYDRVKQESVNNEDPERAKQARDFLKMREEYLQIAFGVRSALAQGLRPILQALPTATTSKTQQVRQVHFEEHFDAEGKITKRVPHTLTVDVAVQATVFDLMECAARIAGALERTGGGELEQLLAKPPANGITKKTHKLSWEQIEWMAANGGRIPPGATVDDLGDL